MRKLIGASLLVLALSGFSYAGNMPTPAPDPQAAPTTQSTTQETEFGHIPNDQTVESTATTVTEVALSLLQNVLSLF
jgi:hypothetical protein